MDTINVKVNNLSISFGKSPFVRDLSFEVRSNEVVAVVGKSGCGKTSLLNAIAGFISHKGLLQIKGNTGMVFQNDAIFPWMTVAQNIAFGNLSKYDVEHFLDMIGLSDKKHSYPYQLSGGQIQRVALARTIASNPDIILMDEPYGALDPHTREQMQTWLLQIWSKEKKTIIFVTHDISEAVYLADKVVVLKPGGGHKKIAVDLPRPRRTSIKQSKKFLNLQNEITSEIY